jgi:hypothetical protein
MVGKGCKKRKSPTWQKAEKVWQQRSRIVQTLNVPQRVRLAPSLAAAWLDSLLSFLREPSSVVLDVGTIEALAHQDCFL